MIEPTTIYSTDFVVFRFLDLVVFFFLILWCDLYTIRLLNTSGLQQCNIHWNANITFFKPSTFLLNILHRYTKLILTADFAIASTDIFKVIDLNFTSICDSFFMFFGFYFMLHWTIITIINIYFNLISYSISLFLLSNL